MTQERSFRHSFLNTVVDNVDEATVLRMVDEAVRGRQSLRIFFLNALKIYEVDRNPAMGEALSRSELVLADGMSVVWASRLLGEGLRTRLSGTDVFTVLLAHAAERGHRIYFLGATEERLRSMIDVVRSRWPTLLVAGARNGYFTEADDLEVISEINRSRADLLFLGFGSPKKELWTLRHRTALEVPVIQGVGGSFDVLAGAIPRAPEWMQRAGLEWLFRLLQEPRRMFKRYFVTNSYFIWKVLHRWLAGPAQRM